MGQLEAENKRLKERLSRIKNWIWAEFKVTIPKYIWLGNEDEEEPLDHDLIDPLDYLEVSSSIKEEPLVIPNVTNNPVSNVNQFSRISNQIIGQDGPVQTSPIFLTFSPEQEAPLSPVTNNDLLEEPQPKVRCRRPAKNLTTIQAHQPIPPLPPPKRARQSAKAKMTKHPPKVDNIPLRKRDPICPICHRRFKTIYNVIKHQKVHEIRESISCPIQGCLRKLLSDRLDLHMAQVHGNYTFKCHYEGCSRSYTLKASLEQHFRSKHLNVKPPPKLFKCSFQGCQKTFRTKLGTEEHEKSHLPENRKELICPNCGKGFTSESTYQTHKRYAHRTDPHPFVCDFEGCGKGFHLRYVFNIHKKIHNKEAKMEYEASRIPCPHCGVMTGRTRMKAHIRIKHEGECKFICEHCGKGYRTLLQLKQHYAVHLNPNGPEYLEEFDKNCPEDIRRFIERGKAAKQKYLEKKKKLKK